MQRGRIHLEWGGAEGETRRSSFGSSSRSAEHQHTFSPSLSHGYRSTPPPPPPSHPLQLCYPSRNRSSISSSFAELSLSRRLPERDLGSGYQMMGWNRSCSAVPPSLLDIREYELPFHRNPDQIRFELDLHRQCFLIRSFDPPPSHLQVVETLLYWGLFWLVRSSI